MNLDEYLKMEAREEGLEVGREEGRMEKRTSVVLNLLDQV